MLERYRKPCIIISCSNGIARGSARSVEGFSIIDAIAACSERLQKFGGHPMAAGFTLAEEDIPAFTAALEEYAAEHYPIMPVHTVKLDAPHCAGGDYRGECRGDEPAFSFWMRKPHADFFTIWCDSAGCEFYWEW